MENGKKILVVIVAMAFVLAVLTSSVSAKEWWEMDEEEFDEAARELRGLPPSDSDKDIEKDSTEPAKSDKNGSKEWWEMDDEERHEATKGLAPDILGDNKKESNTAMIAFLIVGIVAGAVAAVIAIKFLKTRKTHA